MLSPRSIPCPKCGRIYTNGERICPHDQTPLTPAATAPAADPFINTVIDGRFTVLERLGSGGMGVVYKALQNRLDRHIALKVLSVRVGDDPTAADRFRNEALAASRLTNAHTVVVHEFGATEDGALYIAMQLLEGESLRTRLKRGPLPLRDALVVALHICESLAEAHEWQPPIVHRDIKPDNVFVRETSRGDPHATVLDFGLARFADSHRTRLTSANQAIGTPAYMSPEQCRGAQEIDGRSDLYALGAVLFEMIAGRPPFSAPDPPSLLFKHVYDAPPRLQEVRPDVAVPEDIEELVANLLAKLPANRPASAAIVRDRLQAMAERLPRLAPTAADPTTTPTQPMRALPADSGSSSAPRSPPVMTGFESIVARPTPRTPSQAWSDPEFQPLRRRGLALPLTVAATVLAVLAGLAAFHHGAAPSDAPAPIVPAPIVPTTTSPPAATTPAAVVPAAAPSAPAAAPAPAVAPQAEPKPPHRTLKAAAKTRPREHIDPKAFDIN